MRNDSKTLLGAARIFIQGQQRSFTLSGDVEPEVAKLYKIKRHKCKSLKKAQAAVRCTLQRMRDKEGLLFDGSGAYHWPLKMETKMPVKLSNISVGRRTYSLDDFMKIESYPGQRDTEKHAKQFRQSPIFNPENPTIGQTMVFASYMGRVYLIDGHTQRLLHTQGYIKLPKEITGPLYYCKSEAELKTVYDSYNALIAGKGANDQLYSALRLNNVKVKSNFLKNAQGTSGISFAEGARLGKRGAAETKRGSAICAFVDEWRSEIIKLDKLLASAKLKSHKTTKNAGIIAAVLLTHRKSPTKAAQFWELFYSSCGGEGEAGAPWNRLWHQATETYKDQGGGREATAEIVEIALYAFERCDDDDVAVSANLSKNKLKMVACNTYLPETNRAKAKADREAERQSKALAAAEEVIGASAL